LQPGEELIEPRRDLLEGSALVVYFGLMNSDELGTVELHDAHRY
jgi:hypothetical protein